MQAQQPVSFEHGGTTYKRTYTPKGVALHRAGAKIISAAAFAEAQTAATATPAQVEDVTDAIVAAVLATNMQDVEAICATAQSIAQPMALLAGVVTATAPAPSPANPFAGLLAQATTAADTPAKTPRTKAEQVNGVARPQSNGACAKVWAICDAIMATGHTPTIGMVKPQAQAQGLDPTTTQVQYYRWRKHQGIAGRL